MDVNYWEPIPYMFDGVSANYEIEAGSFKAFGFKLAELSNENTTGGDPEHNIFGVSFDLKTMPEMLKMVNAHVIKERRDTSFTTTNTSTVATPAPLSLTPNDGRDFMRYGVVVGGDVAGFDFKANYEMVTGDYLTQATPGAAIVKVDGKASMMEATVGYGMEAMMKSHISFTWHKDSGNDGGSATENGTYNGFFHEQHCSTGCMDLFDYGNLTFMALNAKMSPMDNTTVGLGYYMFKATESGAGAGGSTAGANGGRLTGQDVTSDDLGKEIDLWAEHSYDNGLSTMARLGYFTPGDAFDNATTDRGDKYMQVFLQAKMTF
jgi:hypothetical protein